MTIPACPSYVGYRFLDLVNRQFKAPCPNALWVSNFTGVATWSGLASVAFVVEPRGSPDLDVFARRIVGWRVSRTAQAGFVLDALEQALHDRRPVRDDRLVHHHATPQPERD